MNNLKSVILIIQMKEMTGEIIDTAVALNYFLTTIQNYYSIYFFIFIVNINFTYVF